MRKAREGRGAKTGTKPRKAKSDIKTVRNNVVLVVAVLRLRILAIACLTVFVVVDSLGPLVVAVLVVPSLSLFISTSSSE